jgi:type III secretion system YscQ/HrcQ family protein
LLSARQLRLDHRLARAAADPKIASALSWLTEAIGVSLRLDQAEILWRASGLQRPGVIAQCTWPRLASRLALGIETPLAHAVVDRLLGYDRLPEEGRLQVTPVEWGIMTFAVAETLARLDDASGVLGVWDFTLDRVGPDPFNPTGLGAIVTVRWPVRVGAITGSVRLWLPEALVAQAQLAESAADPERTIDSGSIRGRYGDLAGVWRAEAGTATMARGLGRLRVGGVLPIDGNPLSGTPQSPGGPVMLSLVDSEGRSWFLAEPTPGDGGRRLTLTAPLQRERRPREAIPVNATHDPVQPPGGPDPSPTDVPVTLAVELGRITLPLRRLADLKPGDVVELGRHAREPVELTSGGRLIARGELVQIDTELGVRVTSVFL